MARVFLPASLRRLTAGRDWAIAHGRNVGQLINDLDRQFPGLREQLIQGGDLRPSVAVAVDGEVATGGLLEAVQESSEVHFLPAIGGGAADGKHR